MIDAKVANNLGEAIDAKIANATKKRISTMGAEVVGIDNDGTVWVHIDGGVEQTPISNTTVSVKKGDYVTVEISDGRAKIVGNTTDPSAGVARVNAVEQVANTANHSASSALESAEIARGAAEEAANVAEAVNQHFWYRDTDPGDGASAGAFVTDEERETFLEAIAQGTEPTTARPLHNLLMNAEGILLRAAKRIRAAFTAGSVAFYDGLGNAASNIIAAFGANGAQIGKASGKHVNIDSNGMEVFDNATSLAKFGATSARVGSTNQQNVTIEQNGMTLKSGNRFLASLTGNDLNGEKSYALTLGVENNYIQASDGLSYFHGMFIQGQRFIHISDMSGSYINTSTDEGVPTLIIHGGAGTYLDGGATIINQSSGAVFLTAHDGGIDNPSLVSFGIGSGRINHGVYSDQLSKWLIHGDNYHVYINGKRITDVTGHQFFAGPNNDDYGDATFRKITTDDLPSTTTSTSAILASRDTDNTTAASGTMAKWCKVCQINLSFTTKNQISVPANGNVTNLNLGTLNTGNRPAVQTTWLDYNNGFYGTISTGGVITIQRCDSRNVAYNIAAGTNIVVNASFVIS